MDFIDHRGFVKSKRTKAIKRKIRNKTVSWTCPKNVKMYWQLKKLNDEIEFLTYVQNYRKTL